MAREFIKSPLNYIGGKYGLLPQLMPLFPSSIRCFVDLFAGGGNVGLNVPAKAVVLNDNLTYLMDFYREIQKLSIEKICAHIQRQIVRYELSLYNEAGYKKLREDYNAFKYPLDLFVLVAYSFNHQIRFNNAHEFNNPFGRERSRYNAHIEENLKQFVKRIQSFVIGISSKNFAEFDYSFLTREDFVYCDPPYLITTGSYNDGRRGFGGWGLKEEQKLLTVLDKLAALNVRFALSNVLHHKGRRNNILYEWLRLRPQYYCSPIIKNYANSNYRTKERGKLSTEEILVTNYKPSFVSDSFLPFVTKRETYALYRQ